MAEIQAEEFFQSREELDAFLETLIAQKFQPATAALSTLKDYFGEERVSSSVDMTPGQYLELATEDNRFLTEAIENGAYSIIPKRAIAALPQSFNMLMTVIVWFPKIIIKNEVNLTHTIRDLYVRFSIFNNGKLGDDPIEGIRSTLTLTEAKMGYIHSHLPMFTATNWRNFCLGTGPFPTCIRTLRGKVGTSAEWLIFARSMTDYVQTESLAGGPYISISSLSSDGINMNVPYEYHKNVFICAGSRKLVKNSVLFVKYMISTGRLTSDMFSFVGDRYVFRENDKILLLKFSFWFLEMLEKGREKMFSTRQTEELLSIMIKEATPPDAFGVIHYGQTYREDNAIVQQFLSGMTILTFNGNPIRSSIFTESAPAKKFRVLTPEAFCLIRNTILNYLNTINGNNFTTSDGGSL